MVPPIAILGAGPSGLLLGALLARANIPFTIYERDASASSAQRGGSLDIHGETGQRALRAAGVWDEFVKLARYDAQSFTMMDQNGKIWLKGENPRDAPEIDRVQLRSLLLNAVPKGCVEWGCKVEKVERVHGEIVIEFVGGRIEKGFKLVIGADGAWSKVRHLVTTANPKFSGYHYFETRISPSNSFHSTVSKQVGPGLLLTSGKSRSISAQCNGDDSYRIYLGLELPENWTTSEAVDFKDDNAMRKLFLDSSEFFAGWHSSSTDLIRNCEGDFRDWALYYMPVESFPWTRTNLARDVTLVGDAAHVSTPFVGEGVNCALSDAMDLGMRLAECQGRVEDFDKAVRAYEEKMFPRAIDLLERSMASGKLLFSHDGPKSMVEALAAGEAPVQTAA